MGLLKFRHFNHPFVVLNKVQKEKMCSRCVKRALCSRTPEDLSYLANKKYWNQFYQTKQCGEVRGNFDWMLNYEQIFPYIESLLPRQPYSFLDLGCGTSDFSAKLLQKTKTPVLIYQVDFSPEALKYSQKLFREAKPIPRQTERADGITDSPNLDGFNRKGSLGLGSSRVCFIQASAQNLPFFDKSIDIILDKGTTDSVLKAPGGAKVASEIARECFRVLTPGGVIVQATDEDPDLRLKLLQESLPQDGASVAFKSVESSQYEYFLYLICKS